MENAKLFSRDFVGLLGLSLGWLATSLAPAQTPFVQDETVQPNSVQANSNPPSPAQLSGVERLAWELGPTGVKASLRGLCAASDSVIWASGAAATVIRSSDSGSSWTECGPDGLGQLELRSIHAWNENVACVASAGTPAVILRTQDGGRTWREVFRHPSERAFFDALRFVDDQRGLAFSDPVEGRLLIVQTEDGGRTWRQVPPGQIPLALEGEAGFAASNSALWLGPQGQAWIGTGGAALDHTRLYFREAWQRHWQLRSCPLPSGASQGVFSIAGDGSRMIAVGGDYRPEATSELTAVVSIDGGLHWQPAERPPAAFRSAVIRLPRAMKLPYLFLTTGPTGSEVSEDGTHWQPFSQQGFHVLAASANHVFAAGANGRFAVLRP